MYSLHDQQNGPRHCVLKKNPFHLKNKLVRRLQVILKEGKVHVVDLKSQGLIHIKTKTPKGVPHTHISFSKFY